MIQGSDLHKTRLITLSNLSSLRIGEGNASISLPTLAAVVGIVGIAGLAYNFIVDKISEIKEVFSYVVSAAKKIYSDAVELVTGSISRLMSWLSVSWDAIKNKVKEGYNKVVGFVSDGINSVKKIISLENNPIVESPKATATATPEKIGKLRKGSSEIDAAIRKGSELSGEREDLLRTFIDMESYGDPRAKSGSFLGLGQIGPDAWNDIQRYHKISLPALTGKDDDPRYDPVTNVYATGLLLRQNREYLRDKGIENPTLAQLYIAHNVGRSRAVEILSKDFSSWSSKTKKAVGNQASVLTSGGIQNYVSNVESSMASTYTATNGTIYGSAINEPPPSVTVQQQIALPDAEPIVTGKPIETSKPRATGSSDSLKVARPSQNVTLLKTKVGLVASGD